MSLFPNVTLSVARSNRPVCALAIDAEEDFDWDLPFFGTGFTTNCMKNVRDLQEVVGAYGIVPTYLLTYPVLENAEVVQILRRQLRRGECAAGIQLHPWVNPPFETGEGATTSFSGNLAPALEERKLVELKRRFVESFGVDPLVYRAGRYGIGPHTAAMLERHGFTVDTSLAPRTVSTDEGGPDHSDYDYQAFWFGEHRRLLEVPLCRSIVGWGGSWAPSIYRWLSTPALTSLRVPSVVTRLRCAERITLSPEGNDVAAMLRLVRRLLARGQTIFVLSFHSSSLAIGSNPYVQTKAELHGFYDRLSGVLDTMAYEMGFEFSSLAELPARLDERRV